MLKSRKNKSILLYKLRRRTSACTAEGLCNTPPLRLDANPAQVWPGFNPEKQSKSEQLGHLRCSPCVPVLSQTADVCSVYPITKDKTLPLLCQEKTDWQQGLDASQRSLVPFTVFSEHKVSLMTTLAKGYTITTINLYIHQNKTRPFSPFLHSLC